MPAQPFRISNTRLTHGCWEEPKEDVGVGGLVSGDVARVTFERQNPNSFQWVGHIGKSLGSFVVSTHQVRCKK